MFSRSLALAVFKPGVTKIFPFSHPHTSLSRLGMYTEEQTIVLSTPSLDAQRWSIMPSDTEWCLSKLSWRVHVAVIGISRGWGEKQNKNPIK